MLEIARFSGIYKLVLRNIRAGIGELWRTFNLNAQVKDLQRFVPELTRADIMRGPAGVRAQVSLIFVLSQRSERLLNLSNRSVYQNSELLLKY